MASCKYCEGRGTLDKDGICERCCELEKRQKWQRKQKNRFRGTIIFTEYALLDKLHANLVWALEDYFSEIEYKKSLAAKEEEERQKRDEETKQREDEEERLMYRREREQRRYRKKLLELQEDNRCSLMVHGRYPSNGARLTARKPRLDELDWLMR